ncbi:hypothetical protein [Thalassolituus sp.]|jgi:hypothetical protein|uniref:hypothetical protein n=1 Tax=Thalassolituus sp. TaxID=2030822 RepID=UPI002A80AF53|nr:hypothetical protein [Thalassolituus sp.]|tara:strand:- start:7176 stop:7442 length:267 start_codon:yes stop_codon:yes gene_type:complete
MINRHKLQLMLDVVEHKGLSEHTLSKLRLQFPGVHLTYCLEDDISAAKPYIERPDFNVYLVDSRDHCSVLSLDPENASGLVFAEVISD